LAVAPTEIGLSDSDIKVQVALADLIGSLSLAPQGDGEQFIIAGLDPAIHDDEP